MSDKRQGWLAELKAGDLVIIEYPRSSSTVKKVDKITPTGRINIESYVFNTKRISYGVGLFRTAFGTIQYRGTYKKYKDYRKRSVLALELRNKNFKSLPLEKLVKIKEIIEGSDDE
uniref:hypothetical protein n=1 Tax=Lactococcus lactis TaxID=1358 RepID=UPI0003BA01AD|nr:hypothetical protein [Lactococcus lactis]